MCRARVTEHFLSWDPQYFRRLLKECPPWRETLFVQGHFLQLGFFLHVLVSLSGLSALFFPSHGTLEVTLLDRVVQPWHRPHPPTHTHTHTLTSVPWSAYLTNQLETTRAFTFSAKQSYRSRDAAIFDFIEIRRSRVLNVTHRDLCKGWARLDMPEIYA